MHFPKGTFCYPAGMGLMPHYSHPNNPLQIAEQTAFVFRRWMDVWMEDTQSKGVTEATWLKKTPAAVG